MFLRSVPIGGRSLKGAGASIVATSEMLGRIKKWCYRPETST